MAKRKGKAKNVNGSANRTATIPTNVICPPVENISTPSSELDSHNNEDDTSALNIAIQSAMKVCRLCEAKDGPFLNIFGSEKSLSDKIKDLLPFVIAENDELPHKICFRCSAKIEELHEFVQKCIKTQEKLRNSLGKNDQPLTKTKSRKLWEDKLVKTNLSNDDICDALIKKAMEGIKSIPLKNVPNPVEKPNVSTLEKKSTAEIPNTQKQNDNKVPEKEAEKEPLTIPTRSLRSCNKNSEETGQEKNIVSRVTRSSLVNSLQDEKKNVNDNPKLIKGEVSITKDDPKIINDKVECVVKEPENESIINISNGTTKAKHNDEAKIVPEKKTKIRVRNNAELAINKSSTDSNQTDKIISPIEPAQNLIVEKTEEKETPPFDIMDYVTSIKVNGVGFLFQCKLCNRNFLKKEVVRSHGCAKTGVQKVEFPKTIVHVEQPKNPQPTVKFISSQSTELSKKEKSITETVVNLENKPRPRVGPASKTKVAAVSSVSQNVDSNQRLISLPQPQSLQPAIPQTEPSVTSVQVPLNFPLTEGVYKLIPGPNNTFSLVGGTKQVNENGSQNLCNNEHNVAFGIPESKKKNNKRRQTTKTPNQNDRIEPDMIIDLEDTSDVSNDRAKHKNKTNHISENIAAPTISPTNQPYPTFSSASQPYPVGLFQSIPHNPVPTTLSPTPATFTTPAMKKQSYTVVQTGNPSKLLISTKPPAPVEIPAPTTKGKKGRKRKPAEVSAILPTNEKQPFCVPLEDTSPPKTSEEGFMFISLDPLLQPSYVLPTDNIIQESQISTSTPLVPSTSERQGLYKCEFCNDTFSREKKLLAHAKLHYKRMEEEEDIPEIILQSSPRKRSRKS